MLICNVWAKNETFTSESLRVFQQSYLEVGKVCDRLCYNSAYSVMEKTTDSR